MTDRAYYLYGFYKDKFFGLIVRTKHECGGVQGIYRRRGFKVFWRHV